MISVIQHNCTRLNEWAIAVMEMGVEPRADVVLLQEPLTETGLTGISNSAYEVGKRIRDSTAIHVGSGLVVVEWTDLSCGANDDVIAMDVRRRGQTITKIVNGYDHGDTQSGERPGWKLHWQRVIRQGGTVLAVDFNPQST